MTGVVPLVEARDDSIHGSKAVGLGEAARSGLSLPPGVALSGAIVEAVASGDEDAIAEVSWAVGMLDGPLAVGLRRSMRTGRTRASPAST